MCYVLLFYVFPANIWLLFCIQSVWSDIVFWKQIKLIPKMHISNRYLKQKCCINNSWILSVFCANKLYQFLLFFISGLNQTSYIFVLLSWRWGDQGFNLLNSDKVFYVFILGLYVFLLFSLFLSARFHNWKINIQW